MSDEVRQTAKEILSGLPRFADAGSGAYKPGLDRMQRLLAALGNPEEAFEVIHVAGTNGKGSTASFIASIATAAGLRTGLHTSPHLFHVTERMRVDGRPASDEWFAEALVGGRGLIDEIGPSFFEMTAALSLSYFAEQRVDLAVVEVGMGGRLDATNVLTPILSVITDIGLDHTEFLGRTIEEVAREKAGIIKSGVPVVTTANAPAVDVISEVASNRGAALHRVDLEVDVGEPSIAIDGSTVDARTPEHFLDHLFVGLAGAHQIRNAVTAVRSAEVALAGRMPSAAVVRDGLKRVRVLSGIRGRLEILERAPLVVADVGHNADGLATTLEHLKRCGGLDGRLTVLLGVMRDKDLDAMARRLDEAQARVRPVHVASERALPARELAALLQVFGITVDEPCIVQDGLRAFLSDASDTDALLITGSHLVVAQLENTVS